MATSLIEKVTNNSDSGYCKMPDGTLIQWGNASIEANASNIQITFTIPFINANYGFSTTPFYQNVNDVVLTLSGEDKYGIKVYRKATTSYAQLFSWLVIGRWK